MLLVNFAFSLCLDKFPVLFCSVLYIRLPSVILSCVYCALLFEVSDKVKKWEAICEIVEVEDEVLVESNLLSTVWGRLALLPSFNWTRGVLINNWSTSLAIIWYLL